MYKRTLFALAIAASFAVAEPPTRPSFQRDEPTVRADIEALAQLAVPRRCNVALPAPTPSPNCQPMVRAEMTIVRLHPETMKTLELWDDCDQRGQRCFLTPCQVRKVLEIVKADDRCEVLSSPQMVMLDSQLGTVSLSSNDSCGIELTVTPRVSLDHKFIQMAVCSEIQETTPCRETQKCDADNDCCTTQQTTVQLHRMRTVVTVPTGNSVIMETCRVAQPFSHCGFSSGRFMLPGSDDRVCVIITPSEVNSTCCSQPMPTVQAECVGPCQVFMPAPPMMAMQPMMPCEPRMPGCWTPNRAFAFVPAQEQTEQSEPRTTNRTLEKLMDKYEDACANGDLDKARKIARRCLDIDPTCFMQDR